MKKAKIKNGVIQHVWPWVKELPDGTKLTKNLPLHYQGLNGKQVPDCIVDVPDDVQPGWVWYDDTQRYERKRKVTNPLIGHDFRLEILAERLGITYQELKNEARKRKQSAIDAYRESKKNATNPK